MKLHLGCGKRKIHGWTNIDIDPGVSPDIVDRAEGLKNINDDSVDIIYASHLLEHYRRNETSKVLKVWYNKLKPGGILRLAVPDFEKVVQQYIKKCHLSKLLGFLVGGQKSDFDYHYMVFDYITLEDYLKLAGFKDVKRYNWQDAEHFYVDDYSSCYLPHMDKGSGELMSLNVEAYK